LETKLFGPPQVDIPFFMNAALKYESQPWNLPEQAVDYLTCIRSLAKVNEVEMEEYITALKIFLYLEQFEIDQEIKRHSLKNHKLKHVGHNYIIDVPSLTSEHSIIVPDDKVCLYNVVSKQKIMAKVVKVYKNQVTIQLETNV